MHSKELIEIVKKKRASGASYGIIAQEMGLKRASVQSIVNNNFNKKKKSKEDHQLLKKENLCKLKDVLKH